MKASYLSCLAMMALYVHATPVQQSPPTPSLDFMRMNTSDDGTPIPFTGDVINITRCFCMPEGTKNFDKHAEAGYYNEWIYYNFHSNTWFNVTRYCRTTETVLSMPPNRNTVHKLNRCLTYWVDKDQTPSCEQDGKGNHFCTQLDGRYPDIYMYNDQKRRTGSVCNLATEGEVEKRCAELCPRVGTDEQIAKRKMVNIQGRPKCQLNHHIHEPSTYRWSYIYVDYKVDDMCPTCK